MSSADDDFMNQ
jgi:voltage-dependent calcium channel L type alpha-1D